MSSDTVAVQLLICCLKQMCVIHWCCVLGKVLSLLVVSLSSVVWGHPSLHSHCIAVACLLHCSNAPCLPWSLLSVFSVSVLFICLLFYCCCWFFVFCLMPSSLMVPPLPLVCVCVCVCVYVCVRAHILVSCLPLSQYMCFWPVFILFSLFIFVFHSFSLQSPSCTPCLWFSFCIFLPWIAVNYWGENLHKKSIIW